MDIYIIGIIALAALIFLSAAKTLGEITFLLALLLIGCGYAAVLINAFFGLDTLLYAAGLTMAGIVINRLSAANDIPTVKWRAAGLHASLMAVTFTGITLVTVATMTMTPGNAYKAAGIAYGILAAWHWIIAIRAAARVMRES